MSRPLMTRQSSLFNLLRSGPLKACVLGSGNWGTACGILIAENAAESYLFDTQVKIWVREELVDAGGRGDLAPPASGSPAGDQSTCGLSTPGAEMSSSAVAGLSPSSPARYLHEVMNEVHENIKYLPGFKLPANLRAYSDIVEAVSDADLICFILPHQFMENVCRMVAPHVKSTAKAISLAKGLHITENGTPMTFSDLVEQICHIECSSLSGANVAKDVANKEFCESTIGYKNQETASIWQQLFDRPYFRVSSVPDHNGPQVCGALKNIIALSAGFCDGLGMGSNTKSAIIRIGVMEMKLFASLIFPGVLEESFFESCGFADVITTCFGGRNVRCAAEFIRRHQKDNWEKIESDMLNGMKMQGQHTCKEVHQVLLHFNIQKYFPLFDITYKIAFEQASPHLILKIFMDAENAATKDRQFCTLSSVPVELKELQAELAEKLNTKTNGSAF